MTTRLSALTRTAAVSALALITVIGGLTLPAAATTIDDQQLGAGVESIEQSDAEDTVDRSTEAPDAPAVESAAQPVNLAPPAVLGTARIGAALTATTGAWNLDLATAQVAYSWWTGSTRLTAESPVAGYTPTSALGGRPVSVVVTVTNGELSASAVSEPVQVPLGEQTSFSPTARGTAAVGAKLSVDGLPRDRRLAYQWLRDGKAIANATAATYTLVAADAGKRIAVAVTATADGYAPLTRTSPVTSAVLSLFTRQAAPTISGAARNGQTLTAKVGAWTPAPGTVSYQWLRNGSAISGATKSTYKLVASDVGRTITVRTTISRTGHVSATTESKPTAKILGAVMTVSSASATGWAKVGRTLAASATTSVTGTTLTYQWYRNGNAIAGATARTYTLKTADQGTTLQVRVHATRPGFIDAVKWSGKTATVAAASPAFSGDGMFRVGVDVAPGTYYSNGSNDRYCYWARLNSASDSLYSINANSFAGGRQMVTITSSDRYFESDGCVSWFRYDGTGKRWSSMSGDGIFGVGADILPGTYRSGGTSGCYWARLADAYGDLYSINDNFFGNGRQYVTIRSSDRFFETSGCGTWTRVS